MPVRYSEDSAGPMTRRTEENPSGPSYEEWTKAELAEELERRGLAKSGSKADLIARLKENE